MYIVYMYELLSLLC